MKNQRSLELVHSALGQDHLEHHGIMGMKWGIRRYQPYPSDYHGDGKYVGPKSGKQSSVKQKTADANVKRAVKKCPDLTNAQRGKVAEFASDGYIFSSPTMHNQNPTMYKKVSKNGVDAKMVVDMHDYSSATGSNGPDRVFLNKSDPAHYKKIEKKVDTVVKNTAEDIARTVLQFSKKNNTDDYARLVRKYPWLKDADDEKISSEIKKLAKEFAAGEPSFVTIECRSVPGDEEGIATVRYSPSDWQTNKYGIPKTVYNVELGVDDGIIEEISYERGGRRIYF